MLRACEYPENTTQENRSIPTLRPTNSREDPVESSENCKALCSLLTCIVAGGSLDPFETHPTSTSPESDINKLINHWRSQLRQTSSFSSHWILWSTWVCDLGTQDGLFRRVTTSLTLIFPSTRERLVSSNKLNFGSVLRFAGIGRQIKINWTYLCTPYNRISTFLCCLRAISPEACTSWFAFGFEFDMITYNDSREMIHRRPDEFCGDPKRPPQCDQTYDLWFNVMALNHLNPVKATQDSGRPHGTNPSACNTYYSSAQLWLSDTWGTV